jgi:serine/threonine protein phosphatase 1
MLEQINFQEKDELYILGDIVDRGPQSAEMLWFATEEAPSNVHFLLGNHEDMILAAANNYYNRDIIELQPSDSWAYNYGFETLRQIRQFDKYHDKWEKQILDWIDTLPFYYDIEVNEKKFILVHAALQSKERRPDDLCADGKNFNISIENLPTPQHSQAMLWNRTSWLSNRTEWPFDIVCGHTPVSAIKWDALREFNIPVEQSIEDGIVHFGPGLRKHLIDCGCPHGGKLACLRLDDMKEFYVKE